MRDQLVSIIMPARNAAKYIPAAIESVISQDHPHWELLIADDQSTDATEGIVREYAAQDSRIVLLSVPPDAGGGAARARNYAIRIAKGRYLAFLDSDDVWFPYKLTVQLRTLNHHGAILCYSAYKKMNHEGKVGPGIVKVPTTTSYRDLLKSNVIGCLTAIYDTERVGKVFMPEVPRHDLSTWLRIMKMELAPVEDYAMWLRMARQLEKGAAFFAVGIQQPLAVYRVHSQSASHDKWTAARHQWKVYRDIERIPLHSAIYNFCHYAVRGYRKYLIS